MSTYVFPDLTQEARNRINGVAYGLAAPRLVKRECPVAVYIDEILRP